MLVLFALFLSESILVFLEESLCFIVDKVAQNFKAVPLFDGLFLKQLCDYCDSVPDFFQLCISLFCQVLGFAYLHVVLSGGHLKLVDAL